MSSSHIYTVEGIILKRKNVGEADRILTVFTKQQGKIRVIAKGVRKMISKRAPHIEVFNHLVLTIHKGKVLDMLTDVSTISTFHPIRADLKRIGAAYYLLEVIDGLLAEGQAQEEVFALLQKALTALGNVESARADVLKTRFTSALLLLLGFMESGKKITPIALESYVEEILERRLKTVRLAAQFS